jgi:hypothetical protein
MVIINPTEEGKAEVLLNVFDDPILPAKERITLCFHKKIHGAVNLSESKSVDKILLAKAQIMELIY